MNIGLVIIITLGLLACKYIYRRDKVNFIFVLQFLMFRCYNLSVTTGSLIRSDDMALLLLVMALFMKMTTSDIQYRNINNAVKKFLFFLIISMLVSIFFKELPIIQVIKEARNFIFVIAIFFISNLKKTDIDRVLYKAFLLNSVFCVLFIIQTFLPSLGLLSDMESGQMSMTGYLGFRRFYGYPPLIAFSCLYSFFLFPKNKKYKKFFIALNFLALLLVQSRGMMLNVVMLIVFASVFFKASASKKIIYVVTAIFLLIFVNSIIFSGDTGSRTNNDLNAVVSGNIMEMERPEGDATLSVRIWVLANRIRAINDGGLMDMIFGLGLFVELPLSEITNRGLINVASHTYEGKYCIYTPDISYANHLAFLGYVGSVFFWYIFILMMVRLYKLRDSSRYAQVGFLYLLYMVVSGFNNMEISSSTCLIIPFLLLVGALSETNEIKLTYYGRTSNS